jgi:hypothetical protein
MTKKAWISSETSVSIYQTTRPNIPDVLTVSIVRVLMTEAASSSNRSILIQTAYQKTAILLSLYSL